MGSTSSTSVLVEHRRPFPGTVEMLEGLKDRGYAIGLVSDVAWGLPSEYPQKDMSHFGIDIFFDDMVFSTDVGLRKPHPRLFKLAVYNLGADVGRVHLRGQFAAGGHQRSAQCGP